MSDPIARVQRVFTQTRRAYIYRVLTAVGTVLLAYDLIDGAHLTADLALAAAVLGNGLATAHTPVPPKDDRLPYEETH